jgi:hypothetical protein
MLGTLCSGRVFIFKRIFRHSPPVDPASRCLSFNATLFYYYYLFIFIFLRTRTENARMRTFFLVSMQNVTSPFSPSSTGIATHINTVVGHARTRAHTDVLQPTGVCAKYLNCFYHFIRVFLRISPYAYKLNKLWVIHTRALFYSHVHVV